jgi:hypothetical protein
MVARIAPSPITTSVATGDAIAHAPTPAVISNGGPSRQNHQTFEQPQQIAQTNAPPPPPSPPGEAFAAAVIAGQLPPRPVSPEQLRQRLGAAWQPPASPLRLMDRSV